MKNGYVWEIRTRILFYIALCIALVFMMQYGAQNEAYKTIY